LAAHATAVGEAAAALAAVLMKVAALGQQRLGKEPAAQLTVS
jgi:hypothetical protein